MKITALHAEPVAVPLTRPYAIAGRSTEHVTILKVTLRADTGAVALGAASPVPEITGETLAACTDALTQEAPALVLGAAADPPFPLLRTLATHLSRTPAARAALDMALHDLWARQHDRPLVDLLGRAHHTLPTSITIGIRDLAATLAEAAEYTARGFRVLKVKVGDDLEQDLERLRRLREQVGRDIGLRVDANTGYDLPGLRRFLQATADLDLEFVEQPLPRDQSHQQRALPEADRARLCADESLHDEADATALARPPRPFGSCNIKLMKCGGIAPALRIAAVAQHHGLGLMWGCMDESRVGIAAVLHAAFASPATRWLDLDGSLDLAADFAAGGFALQDGMLSTLDRPGLGITPC